MVRNFIVNKDLPLLEKWTLHNQGDTILTKISLNFPPERNKLKKFYEIKTS